MGMACCCMGVGLLKPIDDRPSISVGSKLKSEKVKRTLFYLIK